MICGASFALLCLLLLLLENRVVNAESSEIRVTNRMDSPIIVSWLNSGNNNEHVFMARVLEGETHLLNSFLGHTFAISKGESHVTSFVVENAPSENFIITNDGQFRRSVPVTQQSSTLGLGADFAGPDNAQICSSAHAWTDVVELSCEPSAAEWRILTKRIAAHRAAVKGRKENERRREYLNREQPKIVPKFTTVGFAKTQVPERLWDQVMAFWKANRHHTVNENWDLGNSYVNHWEIAPSMCYMPESLKQTVFRELQGLVEEWAGGVPLEPTACYGVRLYHRGAKLENHVDRLDTHALSAIINVDQDVEQDWPLEIYDHSENVHQVYLKPRDMLFYESASCIHGRPTSFNGTFYANFFVHFRPKDKWVNLNL